MSQSENRTPDHPIERIFVERWSTRAFSGEAIPDAILFRGFEAARWAPSGNNQQPWRFLYVKRDNPNWARLFNVLNERNQIWAGNAAALVLVLSRTVRIVDGQKQPSRSHAFDAGAAWSNFAHQLKLLGWSTRAIGGYDKEAARAEFSVPDEYALEVVIAVGKPTESTVLPEALRATNQPNDRLPLAQLISEGSFNFV
jgi:nitroreductase